MKINFKEVFSTVSKFGDEHKPEIATGVGIVMMVAGAVGCVVATVKTMRAVADAKEEKLMAIAATTEEYENLTAEEQQEYDDIIENPLPVKEVAKICWKYWVAPGVSIGLGATSIIFSDKEQGRRIGLLTGALASQMAEAKDYKEAVKQIVGEDKEREIEEEQTKRTAKQRDYYEVECIDTGTGTQKYKDYYSGVMIKAGPTYIDACLNELNQYILDKRDRGSGVDEYVMLNDWYDILTPKIGHNGAGDMLAFNVNDGMVELCRSNACVELLDNGESCIILRFRNGPTYINW